MLSRFTIAHWYYSLWSLVYLRVPQEKGGTSSVYTVWNHISAEEGGLDKTYSGSICWQSFLFYFCFSYTSLLANTIPVNERNISSRKEWARKHQPYSSLSASIRIIIFYLCKGTNASWIFKCVRISVTVQHTRMKGTPYISQACFLFRYTGKSHSSLL